jgi:hypothetical protein
MDSIGGKVSASWAQHVNNDVQALIVDMIQGWIREIN